MEFPSVFAIAVACAAGGGGAKDMNDNRFAAADSSAAVRGVRVTADSAGFFPGNASGPAVAALTVALLPCHCEQSGKCDCRTTRLVYKDFSLSSK
jgi:hypothetical protein